MGFFLLLGFFGLSMEGSALFKIARRNWGLHQSFVCSFALMFLC
jgi:hypothetical protein